MVTEMNSILQGPVAMYVNVLKDHHFVALPVDGDRVSLLQGFQDSYTLVDWLRWSSVGMMRRSEFIGSMRNFVSGDSTRRKRGAMDLFSFNRASPQPSFAQKVESDIDGWFKDLGTMATYMHRPL